MQRRSLPIAALVTIGNSAVTGVVDLVEAMLDEPRITAIGLCLEELPEVGAFSRVAIEALRRRVPIVALKTGSSELGAQVTLSHTSSLADADVLVDALFGRLGIARVHDVETFLETLKLMHVHGCSPGVRIASASCSGGEAALLADLAHRAGLSMPELPGATRSRLQALLGDRVSVRNPLDYHTYIWNDRDRLTECFSALLESDLDHHLLLLDFPRADRCDVSEFETTVAAFEIGAPEGRRARECRVLAAGEHAGGGRPSSHLARHRADAGDRQLPGRDRRSRLGWGPLRQRWTEILPLPVPCSAGRRHRHHVRRGRGQVRTRGLRAERAGVGGRRRRPRPARARRRARVSGRPQGALRRPRPQVRPGRGGGRPPLRGSGTPSRRRAWPGSPTGSSWSGWSTVPSSSCSSVSSTTRGSGWGSPSARAGCWSSCWTTPPRSCCRPPAPRSGPPWPACAWVRRWRATAAAIADLDAVVDAVEAIGRFATDHADRLVELEVNPLLVLPRGAMAVDALIRLAERGA